MDRTEQHWDRIPGINHVFDLPFEGRMRSVLDHGGLLDHRMLWKEKVAPDFRHLQGRRAPPHAQLKTILRPREPRTAIPCDVAFLTLRGSGHEAP